MSIITILKWIVAHHKTVLKASLGLCVALLVTWSIILHKQNKKLSESLELAQNNIEAYQEIANDSQQANRVLELTIDQLKYSKDSVIAELNDVREKLNIKPKEINTIATQTQYIYVNKSKEVEQQILIKDTIYTDSIQFNPQTTVSYTIGKDSVNVALAISNKQYLFVYKKKEYKNKKNFFKRLFTLDFKKVIKYKYELQNTNDLIKTDGVRVIEIVK